MTEASKKVNEQEQVIAVADQEVTEGEKRYRDMLESVLITDLAKLGFPEDSQEAILSMLHRADGMILVAGPADSGKTTTLYAALMAAQDETKKVCTVEDVVEYELPGVSHTKANADIGLTFAVQLRSVLRQDPDIILVGEMRDTETAEVAIRAALSGRLLLSTLHAHSAVAAVTRLQDMDIKPFLIASSISGVISQRLVRKLCQDCKTQVPFDSDEYKDAAMRLKLSPKTPLFVGAGCDKCGGAGFRGRIALVEVLCVDTKMRRAIAQKVDSDELRKVAVANGMKTLWQDGMEKLAGGLTTADEIARVLLGAQHSEE